ncbi:MAG TPA: type II secretion system F family protein [Candidatus Paceibacterota bacterium]|nr:type II secretion system F family protein [Candidatus Paceibacterota bacterium]
MENNDKKIPKKSKDLLSFLKIPISAKVFFLQNLSVMIKTGIPLADALKTLGEQTKNKKLQTILLDVYEKIKNGSTFGESIEKYKKDFGELFINMIKAGEASGRLEESLNELYTQSKKDHELRMKVRNAMTYPVIIIIAMIGIVTFLVIFVLPNITALFKDLDVELPITTRIIIAISDFFQAYSLMVGLSVLIFLAVFIKFIRTKTGKKILDRIFLKLPIVSSIIQKINLARMSRSLSSLIKTDIAIVETFNITSRVVGNTIYKETLQEVAEQLKKGQKIAEVAKKYPHIFPPVITQMISVGEETGALDEVLENLANFYEEEVFQTMNTLPTIIEPILMIFIGFGVAIIALAILMPMYSLTESL